MAIPAAPAPLVTMLDLLKPLAHQFRALMTPARVNHGRAVLIVVKDGIIAACLQPALDLKCKRGAEISSRFTPPKLPARRATVRTISSNFL